MAQGNGLRGAGPDAGPGVKLVVLGNVNLDVGLGPVEAWPRPGTEVLGRQAFFRPGGSAANAALAAAALGLPVELHAELGDDGLGLWLRQALQEGGVDCGHVKARPVQTAFSFCVSHPDGERTFFSFAGHLAAQGLEWERVLRAREGSVVLACGYFLLPHWRDGSLVRLFREARRRGLVTALDVGWPPEGRFDPGELQPVLEETDFFLPNRAEALALTGARAVEDALVALARMVRLPVVKDGAGGAWAWDPDGRACLHRPAHPVRPRDTVGAGDVFNAAFIQALAFDGSSLEDALDRANAAAGLAISTSPRRYPTLPEVRAALGA